MTQPPSIVGTSAFDPVARVSPHERLKEMREQCPVFRDEPVKTWFLTRYDDVRETVNDRTLWRHWINAEEGSLLRRMDRDDESDRIDSILSLDEPDHSRVRLPLAKAFYARITAMKPQIEAIIDKVIDEAPADAPFDLINDLAIPIPILAIAKILGVEPERMREFREWSEASILGLNPLRSPEETARMEWGSGMLMTYFTDLMEARRRAPQDDLISDMVALQAGGAPLSDGEIRVNLSALLIGGNLTTTDLIGNGVWLLLNHPEELAKLKADPSLAGAAIEEILRYESPVAITNRVISEEREVGGCPMHVHQSVITSLHAANRDPEVFVDPDRYEIGRDTTQIVSFGLGRHFCMLASLARLEARVALEEFIARFAGYEIDGERSRRVHSTNVRGFATLPTTLAAR